MSQVPPSNSSRRASFPLSSPPQSKQVKSASDPTRLSKRLLSLTQQQNESRAEAKRIGENLVTLTNPHGRQYSQPENRLLLRILHGLM